MPIAPTPDELRARLGPGSSAHQTLFALLTDHYQQHRHSPAIRQRRALWAQSLEIAHGAHFDRSDDLLFLTHTLLVATAEAIAHELLGRDLEVDEPAVFDWIDRCPDGPRLRARILAAIAGCFDWRAVEHDVLGALYQAVIDGSARKELGEHYTPGWLAQAIVEAAAPDPLQTRVLDPSCGSGTFLLHLIRRHLAAAERAGRGLTEQLDGLLDSVLGVDLHPVAVALARVTYLLAIGPDRLAAAPGPLRVPITLGDSMQWDRAPPDPALPAAAKMDLLIGNPPWLAYRHMPAELQANFRVMSKARGLWRGARVATHQDLSALFVTRAIELYLNHGGRFAFVMPGAVLDREQYQGFRGGSYLPDLHAALAPPWSLKKLRPHFFPITAAVIFGSRAKQASAMPPAGERWEGRLPGPDAPWSAVEPQLRRLTPDHGRPATPRSPYHPRFRQGASLVPRVLFMVEPLPGESPDAQNRAFRSARSASEKHPWKALPAQHGAPERQFIVRVHLGETVLPFRVLEPRRAVLPVDLDSYKNKNKNINRILDPQAIAGHPGLTAWWDQASRAWQAHRSSDRLSLAQQLDYHGKLSGQLPILGERVLYTKSGMHLAAARLGDLRAIVDHVLYWAAVGSTAEAHYLCAILNARVVTARVRPLMSYGKDERHIDKYVWALPIPLFDPAIGLHRRLAALGEAAELRVARAALDARHFASQRRAIRELLAASELGPAIEAAVHELLGAP